MTSIESASAQPEAWFKLDRDGRTLAVGGAWTIAEAARLDRELDGLELSGGELAIDGTEISRLDSAGAWLLLRTRKTVEAQGGTVSRFDVPELYQPLIENLNQ
jgi:phospholipid/cholesterol/gamma-HCH transport system permease protein